MSGATIVVGAQWGDEGKGLISAYLNYKLDSAYVVRAGTGSNAEHGLFLKDNKTYLKTNQLPLGWMFNPETEIRIGSGVAIDPAKLLAEMGTYGLTGKTKIDYRCPIITEEHIRAEQESKGMKNIGSTMSGTGFCRADFVLRKAKQAKNIPMLQDYLTDVSVDINTACNHHENVVIESSQGTFLSLAISPDYPNVTSDNVTAMAAADDVLLNWQNILGVVLVVKALPTREGAGNMGNVTEMSQEEMAEKGFLEPSSIEGTTRRKTTSLDWKMLHYAVEVNGATQIALTFLDHYDPKMKDVKEKSQITDKAWELIQEIEDKTNVPVSILNTGKSYDCIIDLDRTRKIDFSKLDKILTQFSS